MSALICTEIFENMSKSPSIDDPPFVFFPGFEAFYLISMHFSTDSGLRSAQDLSEWVSRYADGDEEFPPQLPLNDAQNILNQGAAISRFFWPTGKKYKERGDKLREAFWISENSPFKDRKLRNMAEHYDEYLDDYLRENFAGQYVPDYFGDSPPDDRGPLKLFRAYFTDTGKFEIFGESYAIEPLVEALIELHQQLEHCLENGSRFQNPPINQKRTRLNIAPPPCSGSEIITIVGMPSMGTRRMLNEQSLVPPLARPEKGT